MIEYGLPAGILRELKGVLTDVVDAAAGHGAELLRFARDNPLLFVTLLAVLVGTLLFMRLR